MLLLLLLLYWFSRLTRVDYGSGGDEIGKVIVECHADAARRGGRWMFRDWQTLWRQRRRRRMARLKIPKVVCGGILSLKGSLWRLQDTLTRMRWRLLTCRNEGLLLGRRRAGGVGREGLLQVLRQARPVPGLVALPDLEGRLGRGLVNLDWKWINITGYVTTIK